MTFIEVLESGATVDVLDEVTLVEVETSVRPGPQGVPGLPGDPGEGVPAGGTAGQVLGKASDTDFDTEWVDQTGGGGAVDSVNGRIGDVVGLAEASDLNDEISARLAGDITEGSNRAAADAAEATARAAADAAEAAARAAADALLQPKSEKGQPNGYAGLDGSGTVPDAQIPAAIARDSEVTTAVATEATARAAADALLIPLTQKGVASGVASLDSGGKIPAAQVPAIAISDYLGAVASQAAMLALTGQRGDWAIRTDTTTTWMLIDDDASVLANWKQLATPADAVSSVNGRTGAVTGLAEASDVTAEAAARAAADAGLQPLDSDLTAIATLTTTAFGRALLELANAAALRSTAGLGTAATRDAGTASGVAELDGTGVVPLAQSATVDSAHIADNAVTLAKLADIATASILGRTTAGTGDPEVLTASQVRILLALVVGADVQAHDADLDAIAALTTTTFGRALLVLADAAALRTAAGLGSLATLSTITTSEITDGTIVNADVSATAAIAYSKLALTGSVAVADLAFDPATQTELDAFTTRRDVSFSTGSLAANAAATADVTLDKADLVYRVVTNRPARVRAYSTSAHRTADSARAVGTDPTGNHGLLLEIVTTATMLTIDMAPPAHLINLDGTPGTTIYFAITNLDTGAGVVTTTVTVRRGE